MERSVRRREEIKRGKFTVESVDGVNYKLYSHQFDMHCTLTIFFYRIEKASEGDVLEIPDYMLKIEEGRQSFSNRLLQFCEPNDKMAIPKNFNIELDYAYITYKKTGERILIQRCYG